MRQKIGDPGSIKMRNVFPFISVLSKLPQLPYGGPRKLATLCHLVPVRSGVAQGSLAQGSPAQGWWHKVTPPRLFPHGCFHWRYIVFLLFVTVFFVFQCFLRCCCIDGAGMEPQERSCAELNGSCAKLMKEEELSLKPTGELFAFLMLLR